VPEIRASPIPYSIVRATQFFEFVKRVAVGAPLSPGVDDRLGEIRFEDWLGQSAVPAVPA
jgi:hypothetical protein